MKLEIEDNKIRIIQLPKWLMQIIRKKAQALCIPLKSVLYISVLFFVPELILIGISLTTSNTFFTFFMFFWFILLGFPTFFFYVMHFLRIVLIRKDCNSCKFKFHIIIHEKNHYRFNSLNEKFVEEETLKQTGKQLFPLLLENPTLCLDCAFRRKIYQKKTNEYVEKKE